MVLIGKDASVKVGTYSLAEMGVFSFNGFTREALDATAFGDDIKEYVFATGDGGTISFSGNYDPTDSTGQTLIESACVNASVFTNNDLRFYINNTSYFCASLGNNILITKCKTVNFERAGIGTINFEGVLSGGSIILANFFTSEFTGDGASLGESWIEVDPNNKLVRASNQLKASAGPGMAYWDATFSDNQYSQLVFKGTNGGTGIYSGPAVRMSGAAVTAVSNYTVFYRASTGAEALFISKYDSQSLEFSGTILGAQIDVVLNADDVLKIQAVGTTITMYINGVLQATRTDSAITSGRVGAIVCDALPGTDWITWDNWEGGNV